MKDLIKKVTVSVMTLIMMLGLTGCFGSKVGNELEKYINEDINPIETKVLAAIEEFNNYPGGADTNPAQLKQAVNKSILPVLKEGLAEAEQLSIETDEVKQVHAIYIESRKKQLQAIEKMVLALESNSQDLLSEATALHDEAVTLDKQYEEEIKSLAEKHNVPIITP